MPAARRQRTIQLCQAAKASGDLVREVSNTVKLKRVGQGFNGLCPLHADKFPSLWVYPDGHWHCYGCPPTHNHGSILDWRQALYGETLTEAATAILQQFGPPPEYRQTPASVRASRSSDPDDGTLRHWQQVYQQVWIQLTLDAPDQAELQRRGLMDPVAWRRHGLVSVPNTRRDWSSRIGESVACVPGFSTREDGLWHGPAGLVIPVRLPDGRMAGAQIRVREDQRQTGKYVWWSTPPEARQEDGTWRYPDGAKAWVIAHWAWPGGQPDRAEEVVVTEGPLKAIVIAEQLGVPVIGVPGVQAWMTALHGMHRLSTPPTRVLWAFDQDQPPNPAVQQAQKDGGDAFQHAFPALRQALMVWDGHAAKGLDDALVQGVPWQIHEPKKGDAARGLSG